MRLTLRWGMASRLPTSIVSAASHTRSPPQSTRMRSPDPPPNPETRILTSTANAAAFTPAAMKPVTGAGAPSYTSGTHMWNGTAATLNANPDASSATAAYSNPDAPEGPPLRSAAATSASLVEPVAPNASAAP